MAQLEKTHSNLDFEESVRSYELMLDDLDSGTDDFTRSDEESYDERGLATSKRFASDEMPKMKIPNSVIYVVGDVLGRWYYSHSKLDTLFGGNGFPGDPPSGNCIQKCQEWFKIANNSSDCDPLELLGSVLVDFMNLSVDSSDWQDGSRRIIEILKKNGLAIDLNGHVVPVLLGIVSERTMPIAPHESAPLSNAQKSLDSSPVIVLVTVNDNETHALLDTFVGAKGVPEQVTRGGVTYNDLGYHGGHWILNTVCEMGAGGIGASQQRTHESIEHWSPKAIIAVGIAFGLDEMKQSIGDVLVSTHIQDYELGRLNPDGNLTPRGDRPSCGPTLLNRFRQTDAIEKRRGGDWPKVRFGTVLSGQKLVDNLDYRESLKALFSEAIGGEMEGGGVYVSASRGKVDWIVVKAICDWGHDKNQADKDAWQRLAAKNAAQVIKAALDVGLLYDGGAGVTEPPPRPKLSVMTGAAPALAVWQNKLDFLLVEEAKVVEPTQKFKLQQDIAEARAKLREYGGLA